MLYNVLRKVNFKGKIIIIDSNNIKHEYGNGDPLIKIKLINKLKEQNKKES